MTEIRRKSFTNLKKHPVESILIGLITGILMAAVLVIAIFGPTFLFLVIPLLFLPIYFSGFFNHYSLRFDDVISFKNSIKYVGFFFRSSFRSSFKGIVSFAKSFLIGSILFTLSVSIASYFLTAFNPEFIQIVNELNELMATMETIDIDAVNDILNSHGGLFGNLIIFTLLPAIGVGFILFMYFISYSALSVYMRLNINTNNPSLYSYLLKETNKISNRKLLKDFLSLNWPMFLLGALGFTGGCFLAYYLNRFDIFQVGIIGMIGGLLAMSFFLPFFFNNMEAIYETHNENVKKAFDQINRNMLEQLQNSLRISKEQQEEIQKALNELNNRNEEEAKESSESSDQNQEKEE